MKNTNTDDQYIKILNRRTGVERLVDLKKQAFQLAISQDEEVVPFTFKNKWMHESLVKMIASAELDRIKYRIDNLEAYAQLMASRIPGFFQSVYNGTGGRPKGMTNEETQKFKQEFSNELSFYSKGHGYLMRGLDESEVEEILGAFNHFKPAFETKKSIEERAKSLLDAL